MKNVMTMAIVSANYLDRDSDLKWLVRLQHEPIESAVAVKELEATGVKFIRSSADEEGFGCKKVALCETVSFDVPLQRLRFNGFGFEDPEFNTVRACKSLKLGSDGRMFFT